ncbi:hypothetical protein PAMA_011905 [Pampus argenteus]
MKTTELVFLLVLVPLSYSVKHSLTYFMTASSGLQTFPEFVTVSVVDDVLVGYCDSENKKAEPKQEWVKALIKDNPQHAEWHAHSCVTAHLNLKSDLINLKGRFNQTGGVHIFQNMGRCEWDDETNKTDGFEQYGYDGEDLLVLDFETMTWIAPKSQARIIKQNWDQNKGLLDFNKNFYANICPQWLKEYLHYGKSSLLRTDRPSRVSLLQKTPSSPVSCHATGFYPNRAMMFWRKDGEELHNGVEPGELLPNHDGSFQMSVDLDLSSVKPEDWRKYECVFQLSGVKDDIVTKLDKAVIRSNWVPPSEFPTGPVTGSVVGLLLLAVCIAGVFIWTKKNNGFIRANSSESSSSRTSSIKDDLSCS